MVSKVRNVRLGLFSGGGCHHPDIAEELYLYVGKTIKEVGMFRHTEPFFKNLRILTVYNLYIYSTASELIGGN